jgi:hypothetical protein
MRKLTRQLARDKLMVSSPFLYFKFRNKIGLDAAIEALKECRRSKKATMDELWVAPTLLGSTAPRLLTYPRETVVAEKLEAMVKLGIANSRMKDFYDMEVLCRTFSFDGKSLRDAIRNTFKRRGTELPLVVGLLLGGCL